MTGPCDACGRHTCAPDATVCGACRGRMTRADLLVALADTIAELRRDEATMRRVGTPTAVAVADDAAKWARRCEAVRVGLAAGEPLTTERGRAMLALYGSAEVRERIAGRVPPVTAA